MATPPPPPHPPSSFLLCLLRHGESTWNQQNRFTGWTDVDVSEAGRLQALRAGNILAASGHRFTLAYTSVLKRAIHTMWTVLDELDQVHLPDIKSWRLNERHYGALQGLDKVQIAERYGPKQVHVWRRSWANAPPALLKDDPRHPRFDARYAPPPGIAEEEQAAAAAGALGSFPAPAELPNTESLKDCVARTLPFWRAAIEPAILRGERVLVVAHGNSLRGIVKHLDGISDEDIAGLEIPVGTPLIYELERTADGLKAKSHHYLGEPQTISPPGTVGSGTGELCTAATFGILLTANDASSGAMALSQTAWPATSTASSLSSSLAGGRDSCGAEGVCGWLRDLQRVGLVSQPPGSPSGLIQVSPARIRTPEQPSTAVLLAAANSGGAQEQQQQQQRGEPLAQPGPARIEIPELSASAGEAIAEGLPLHLPPGQTPPPLPLGASMYVDSIQFLLQHTSFILVDATVTPPPPGQQPAAPATAPGVQHTAGLPASRAELLAAIAQGLDPQQHVLLAMVQARPGLALQQQLQQEGLAGQPRGVLEAWGTPESGPQELQVVGDIVRAVGPKCRVVAVRIPPPPLPPAEPTAGRGPAGAPAGDEARVPPAGPAAPGSQAGDGAWQVLALGSADARDARRVALMLLYTGRPAAVVERALSV